MKQSVKILCVFVCAILMFSPLLIIYATDSVIEDSTVVLREQKIYSNATADEEFADNRVLVVMDKNIGSINKTYEKSFFGSVDIREIVDLTKVEPYKQTSVDGQKQLCSIEAVPTEHMVAQIEENNFHQILQINLSTKSKENVLKVIKKLEAIDGIVYVGPDYISGEPGVTPSDTHYNSQTGLTKIAAPQAWDITTGTSDVYVGVIDSGISNHQDLNANLVSGWDFFNENSITNDDPTGHGTHVAGTIGAVGNNSVGVAGVAWDVSIVPLQIINQNNRSYLTDVIEAITYATNNNIQILNHSWWNYTNDFALKTAIANYPGLYVCIAGNAQQDIDITPNYPASFNLSNMISVANTTSSDVLNVGVDENGNPNGSSYGVTTVHLAAPGTNIYNCFPDGSYYYMTGTSMAAPHVTGVAALIKSIRPDLSAHDIKELILNNVDRFSSLLDKCITSGRLNAYKAVRAATKPQTFTGDVNGDGRSDIILSRKVNGKRALTVYTGHADGSFAEPITTQFSDNFVYTDPAFAGDFNGDGLTDIVIHWRSSSNNRRLLVYTSKGNGTFNAGVNLSSTRYHDPVAFPCSLLVEDVNGDGKDDLIVHYRNNTNGYRYSLVYKGTSASPYFIDATTTALASTDTYKSNEPVYTGDFNGDGYGDMLVQWVSNGYRQLRVYTGKSNGTFNAGVNLNSMRAHRPADYFSKSRIADTNGDNKDDYIVLWKNGGEHRNMLVYRGSSSSPYMLDATTNALSTNDYYINNEIFRTGDVNGDGRSDIIIQSVSSQNKRYFCTYTANADATYNTGIFYETTNSSDPWRYAETYLVADVNGDGKEDFITIWKNTDGYIRLYTYLGTSQGTFTAAVASSHSTNIPHFNC